MRFLEFSIIPVVVTVHDQFGGFADQVGCRAKLFPVSFICRCCLGCWVSWCNILVSTGSRVLVGLQTCFCQGSALGGFFRLHSQSRILARWVACQLHGVSSVSFLPARQFDSLRVLEFLACLGPPSFLAWFSQRSAFGILVFVIGQHSRHSHPSHHLDIARFWSLSHSCHSWHSTF